MPFLQVSGSELDVSLVRAILDDQGITTKRERGCSRLFEMEGPPITQGDLDKISTRGQATIQYILLPS